MAKGLGADEPYWQSLAQGELRLPRCARCRRWRWPAPFRCGDCGSTEMDWVAVDPVGRIYTWTRTWHRFAGTETFPTPYVPVLVELPDAGGIRLLGLLDKDLGEPAIGKKVTGRVVQIETFGKSVPAWWWSPKP